MQPTPIHDERWLPVPGYEGRYEVSNEGRIRSLDTTWIARHGAPHVRRGKMKTLMPGKRGYLFVALYRDNKITRPTVHSLVLSAFVGPRPDGFYACHNNGNPADNRLSNLRWDTPSSNQMDRVKHDTHARGTRNPNNVLTADEVRQIRAMVTARERSQKDVAAMFGVSTSAVGNIVHRRAWAWLD